MALGDLVTRLTADTAPLTKGLSVGKSQISNFASAATSALAPIAATLAGAFGAPQSLSAAREQLQSERKLAATLEATGNAAGLSGQEIASYAAELQGMTNFGD